MTYDELKRRVGWGEEFSFYLGDELIWISQNEEGYYLTRGNGSFQAFESAEALFQSGKMDGKTMPEIRSLIGNQF